MIDHLRKLIRHNDAGPRYGSSRAMEQDVVHCYRLLLDHDPDEAGMAYWRALIEMKQIPISVIVDAIMSSAEFKAARATRIEPALVQCSEFEIFVRPNDLFIGRAIHLTKQYEPHVAQAVRRLLQPGDTFVDVGANVGYFTLLAATLVGPQGNVIAFEPNPDNCRLLHHSLAQNGLNNVRLYENAVAEATQRFSFSSGGADSNARILRAEELHGRNEHFAQVQAVTLDEALQDVVTRVDLIKMDIEGAEPRAWRGMQSVLQQYRPVIISEYAPDLIRLTSDCDPRSYLEQLWQEHTVAILERSGAVHPAASIQEIVDAQLRAAAASVAHLDLIAHPR